VLHKHGAKQGPPIEDQADAFASAFLMPRETVLAARPKFVTLERLIQLKKRWGVSVAALNHRLHKLKITTDWQYRRLCIEISERGYRKSEPEGMPRESSQLLAKVFAQLRSEGVSRNEIARDLKIHSHDLNAMVFGLVMTDVPGGGQGGKPSARFKGLSLAPR
jgi:Zn-dependent peptidase ImmA (M78 family)